MPTTESAVPVGRDLVYLAMSALSESTKVLRLCSSAKEAAPETHRYQGS